MWGKSKYAITILWNINSISKLIAVHVTRLHILSVQLNDSWIKATEQCTWKVYYHPCTGTSFFILWFWRDVPSYQHLHVCVVSFNVRSLQIPVMKEHFEVFCRWFKLSRKVFCMKKSFCPWATGQLTLDLAQVADTSLQVQYILSVLVVHKYYSLPSGIYSSVLSLRIAICEGLHTTTFLVKVSNTVSDVHF